VPSLSLRFIFKFANLAAGRADKPAGVMKAKLLARKFRKRADMGISIKKTNAMFVRKTPEIARPVEAYYEDKEVLKLLAHSCEACGKGPPTKHGLHVHGTS